MVRDLEWIAHRGESADAPENTMAAFRLAWERGVTSVELDVHLTADGDLIVCHDANTWRTTGVPMRIAERKTAALRDLDAGSWKGAAWKGERMPLLGEALGAMPTASRFFVEVKVGPEAIPAVAQAVREAGARPEQVVVISFGAEAVAEARRSLPEHRTFLLSGFRRDPGTGAWSPTAEALIRQAEAIGTHGLSVSADGPVDRAFVAQAHAAGLALYVWTIDDVERARTMLEAGVDGITSNRAAGLRREAEAPPGQALEPA